MWQGLARFARNRMALFGAAVLFLTVCGASLKLSATVSQRPPWKRR